MTTTKAPSLLHPGPWLSGALLLVGTGAAFEVIHLIAQGAQLAGVSSPRVIALVGLAMIAAPIVLIALAHHATQKVLDRLGTDEKRSMWPGLTSWWTGMFAWLVSALVSCSLLAASGLVDSGHLVQSATVIFARNSLLDLLDWPALVWVFGAGLLYTFERQAKHSFATAKAGSQDDAPAPWKFYAGSLVRGLLLTTFLAGIAGAGMVVGIVALAAAGRESHSIAAVLGVLTMFSPVVLVALADHGVRHIMRSFGRADDGLGKWPRIGSWWTGLYSWFVLSFGGGVTLAIHGLIFGLESVEARSPFKSATIIFFVVAAVLFHVEATVRRRVAAGAE